MSYVLANLDGEWRHVARCGAGRRALQRWAEAYPALGGARDLGGLLERRRVSAAGPAILAALAQLAPGDELAARTLLQALLPGLVRLARTTAADDPDAIDEVVSLGWERIRTYPPDRPGPVAANVVLDVRKRYRRYRRRTAIRSVDLAAVAGTSRGHGRPAEDEALDRLAMNEWLVRQRALVGERCYRAVVRTGVWGLSLAEHAAEEDTTVSIIYQRRWRAMQRMRPLPLAG
jgi:DNA-directed RNA polymerase specialized sigma24 family protein